MRNNKQRTYCKDMGSNPFEERGDDAKHHAKGSLKIKLKTSLEKYGLKDELDNLIWAQRLQFKELGPSATYMKTHLGLNNHILGLI